MKQKCESCPTKLDCVSAFGIFWSEKSQGGQGCNHPFRYTRTGDGERNRKKMELEMRGRRA